MSGTIAHKKRKEAEAERFENILSRQQSAKSKTAQEIIDRDAELKTQRQFLTAEVIGYLEQKYNIDIDHNHPYFKAIDSMMKKKKINVESLHKRITEYDGAQ